ncbi:GNAT family N-acetyltransferase [Actinocorallia longicatena]|uniref:N-acetyltransferase domain-containing protein n=1 Tax=Actinocorallia longicatena TaxID=111803 RepID=A0ABP6QHD9_9ACTN
MAAIGSGARTLVRRPTATPTWAFGDLLLRRYRPADHPAVLSLHREGLARIGLRPGDGVYYEHDLHRLEELYLRDGTGEFLVGTPITGGPPVAMGGLRRHDDTTAEMVRLRVRPDLQRLGYGAAVLQALEERARLLGYRRLIGDTTEFQGPAIELYRKYGWTELRREIINGIVNIYGEKFL